MTRAASRDELTDTAADAAIEQACRILRLPGIRAHNAEIAAAATRQLRPRRPALPGPMPNPELCRHGDRWQWR
jgi:hypothetical protein